MFDHVEIAHLSFFSILFLWQGEAFKDKIYAGKTPRSVCPFWFFEK